MIKNISFLLFLLSSFLILVILASINKYLYFKARYPKWLNLIGIFVHEFGHWIFCLLTLSNPKEFKVKSTFGYVKNTTSFVDRLFPITRKTIPFSRFIAQPLITIGPLVMGTLLFFFIFTLFQKDIELLKNNTLTFIFILKILLFLPLFLSVSAFVWPSRQDWKNASLTFLFFLIFHAFFWQKEWLISFDKKLILLFLFMSIFLFFSLVINLITIFGKKYRKK